MNTDCAPRTSPIPPEAVTAGASANAGEKRSMKPVIPMVPAPRCSPITARPSASVVAIGFSRYTGRPAANAVFAIRACKPVGARGSAGIIVWVRDCVDSA